MVIDGKLHPKFSANSKSKFIRNGVSATPDGKKIFFLISNKPLKLYWFACYFEDHLNLKYALFLDGNLSRLYAPSINCYDFGLRPGPTISTVGEVETICYENIYKSQGN